MTFSLIHGGNYNSTSYFALSATWVFRTIKGPKLHSDIIEAILKIDNCCSDCIQYAIDRTRDQEREMSNRRGMFLGDGSGEYDTLATLHQLAATDSEEEGEEADYALVDSSSGDDSYHSDNDEIAEYWDPYREPCVVEYCTMSLCMVRVCVCGEFAVR